MERSQFDQKPWGKHIDDISRFLPRLYAEPADDDTRITSFYLEDRRVVDFQVEGVKVLTIAFFAFVTACSCSLLALCAKGAHYVLYRPDRVARQFGYDQGRWVQHRT